VPGIFAAGDVAAAWHPFYGRRLRIEHWANARFGGTAAASGMLGGTQPYDRIPSLFSDQYDLSMESVGLITPDARLVVRGDLAAREFTAFWLVGDRLVAGLTANVHGLTKTLERLIRSRVVVEPEALADPSVELDALPVAA